MKVEMGMQRKVVFTLVCVLLGLLVVYVFFVKYVAQMHRVTGPAMDPNYTSGQICVTNKLSYIFSAPERGEVVVFKHPPKPENEYIQRIVGLPGEKISIAAGEVYVNDKPLSEPYLKSETVTKGGGFTEATVPQDQYFVMGDNREHSSDSREWGFVPRENIIGKPFR